LEFYFESVDINRPVLGSNSYPHVCVAHTQPFNGNAQINLKIVEQPIKDLSFFNEQVNFDSLQTTIAASSDSVTDVRLGSERGNRTGLTVSNLDGIFANSHGRIVQVRTNVPVRNSNRTVSVLRFGTTFLRTGSAHNVRTIRAQVRHDYFSNQIKAAEANFEYADRVR
jgi:hypothetical protein